MGFLAILFGHLKNDLFLIFSRTWCTGSRNTALIAWVLVEPDCPTKCLRGWLLLYWSNLNSLISWGITLAFLFPCYWSSSTLLYLSIWFMSWRTLVTGCQLKTSLNCARLGGRPWKCWWSRHQSHHLSHWTFPSICLSTSSESRLLAWIRTVGNLCAEGP